MVSGCQIGARPTPRCRTPAQNGDIPMKPMQKLAAAGALAGVSVLGGAIGASVLGTAGAATSSTTTPAAATAPASQRSMPAHGSAAHEDTEKAVTGDAATK